MRNDSPWLKVNFLFPSLNDDAKIQTKKAKFPYIAEISLPHVFPSPDRYARHESESKPGKG
jgi:hypothetical protein